MGTSPSQFLSNVYLSGFDYYVKETLGCRRYIRYMDDMVSLTIARVVCARCDPLWSRPWRG